MINPIVADWRLRTKSDKTPECVPNAVTSGFAVDSDGYFPVIYRGPNVRSAKNCWSLPSGLHECGFTLAQQLEIELAEELNLKADYRRAVSLGTYENITAQDQWHWVITVLAIPVVDLSDIVNKEPDKHPEIRWMHVSQIGSDEFNAMQWAPGLGEFLREESENIKRKIVTKIMS